MKPFCFETQRVLVLEHLFEKGDKHFNCFFFLGFRFFFFSIPCFFFSHANMNVHIFKKRYCYNRSMCFFFSSFFFLLLCSVKMIF